MYMPHANIGLQIVFYLLKMDIFVHIKVFKLWTLTYPGIARFISQSPGPPFVTKFYSEQCRSFNDFLLRFKSETVYADCCGLFNNL